MNLKLLVVILVEATIAFLAIPLLREFGDPVAIAVIVVWIVATGALAHHYLGSRDQH